MKQEIHSYNESIGLTVAIVCKHIAEENLPILCAGRMDPVDPADSGWQFLCGCSHIEADARIWAINEVLEITPSLAPYLILPAGTTISREDITDDWIIIVQESENQDGG